MKSHVKAVVIGGGVVGCSVLYHLAKRRLDRHHADRALGADLRLDLARRRRLPHAQRRPQRRQAAGLHDQPLQGAGGADRPVLRAAPGRRLPDGRQRPSAWTSCAWRTPSAAISAWIPSWSRRPRPRPCSRSWTRRTSSARCGIRSRAISTRPAPPTPMPRRRASSAPRSCFATAVKELTQEPDGTWNVVTEQGTVKCEHVVNAGGLWAREIGRMVGLELPVLAMEHMYLLTEDMPEVIEFNKAHRPRILARHRLQGRDLHAPGAPGHPARHLREGLQAVVAGRHAVGFRPRAAAARHRPHRAFAGSRLPPFPGARKGRHQADHQRPLHLRAGRQPAGRAGAGADQFLVGLRRHGRLQPRRRRRPGAVQLDGRTAIPASTCGAWTSPASANGRRLRYTNAKVRENYSRRFSIRFPNEELPAARPAQTTPLYDIMVRDNNAVMGDSWGLETPLWFAPKGTEPKDIVSFHRSNDFEHVGNEVRAVRERRRRHRDRQFRQIPGERPGRGSLPQPAC